MRTSKELSPNQDTYKELRRKLKRRLRDLKKRGFTPSRAFKEEWTGDMPDKVKSSLLNKMKNVLENIYKYVRYYDPLTEKYISGLERRKQEKSESARKAAETRRERARERDKYWEEYDESFDYDTSEEYLNALPEEKLQAIQLVEEMLDEWSTSPDWTPELQALKQEDHDTIANVFKGARNTLGDDVVAENIINNQFELLPLLNEALYESGNKYKLFSGSGREGIRKAIDRITAIIYGRPLTVAESKKLAELSERTNESE